MFTAGEGLDPRTVETKRLREEMMIMANPDLVVKTGRFPRRAYLDTLSSMAKGNPLIVVSDNSFGVMLEGVPLACCVYKSLIRMGWVEKTRIRTFMGIVDHYFISERGMDFYRTGQSWWNGLTLWGKIKARITE